MRHFFAARPVAALSSGVAASPSVPTMMRHLPPGSLDPQARKDPLAHAHAPHSERCRGGRRHDRRPTASIRGGARLGIVLSGEHGHEREDPSAPAGLNSRGVDVSSLLARRGASPWLAELLKRKSPKLAAVALANKMARIAWKLMLTGETYTANSAPAALAVAV